MFKFFVIYFVVGLTIELLLGQFLPSRAGSEPMLIDYFLLPIPAFLLFLSATYLVFGKLKKKLTS